MRIVNIFILAGLAGSGSLVWGVVEGAAGEGVGFTGMNFCKASKWEKGPVPSQGRIPAA